MNEQTLDFYNRTNLKSYNLNESMRYQLNMLDQLDVFTRKHSENVASITCRLCEYLHCNQKTIEYCTICAYLHDIGKQFIPPKILQKTGPLTDEEFEVMKTENEQLKQQLNLAEKYGEYKTVPGAIISRDISNYSKTLVINIGSNNGIKENMTVIADEGLVGYIVSTTPTTAKIQTIVDSASSTSCLASTTRDIMVCKGTIESEATLKATNLSTDANIIQGDSVETSGMGGIYTKGIHVGRVKKIVEGTNKIDTYAVIEAAVDFKKLETVLVIIQ